MDPYYSGALTTYKTLSTTQPPYLYNLVSIQLPHGHNTCSSSYVTLIKPSSSLKVTHRSFRHVSRHLWNQLPTSHRIPHPIYSSPSQRPSFEHACWTCYTLLSPSITFSLFHSKLKTYLFTKSYPPPVMIVSALVYDRARLLLLFNLSLFLSFELSRYCSLIGSFM